MMKLSTGISSYQLSVLWQCGQCDLPEVNDFFCGRRRATTFRKLPTQAPKTKNAMLKKLLNTIGAHSMLSRRQSCVSMLQRKGDFVTVLGRHRAHGIEKIAGVFSCGDIGKIFFERAGAGHIPYRSATNGCRLIAVFLNDHPFETRLNRSDVFQSGHITNDGVFTPEKPYKKRNEYCRENAGNNNHDYLFFRE